jgi:hypothetical protein
MRTRVPLTLRLVVGAPEEVPIHVTDSPVGSDQSCFHGWGAGLGRSLGLWQQCGRRRVRERRVWVLWLALGAWRCLYVCAWHVAAVT